jgi:hypothetical protein
MKRDPTDMMWYDVGNRHAAEKTSQALRERSQLEKNGMSAGTSETDVRKRLLEQALSEAKATRIRLCENGGTHFADGLDPTTFKLLSDGTGSAVRDFTDESFAGTSTTKDGKIKQSDGNKSLGKPALHDDFVTETIPDKRVATDSSSSFGPLDDNGNIVVTENDILCGRGGLTNHHKGNKRFRDLVSLHRPDYIRAVKVSTPTVARMIVRAIRNSDPPGRFLQKDTTTNKWVDIGDKRAAEKASQALRERPLEDRANEKQGKPEVDVDTTAKGGEVLSKDAKNGSSKPSRKNGAKMEVVPARNKRVNCEVNGGESGKVSKLRHDTGL